MGGRTFVVEEEAFRRCYRDILLLAKDMGSATVFDLYSTGDWYVAMLEY